MKDEPLLGKVYLAPRNAIKAEAGLPVLGQGDLSPLRPENVTYHDQLCFAMQWLAQQDSVVFFGQGVGNAGTAMSDSLRSVPAKQRVELPVAEEMQVGMCVGMSLNGFVPVCVIPRWNFMLRAADQVINHMDRLPLYSASRERHGPSSSPIVRYQPKVIIRVAVPSASPFNPGPQHDADFTAAFRLMLRTTEVVTLEEVSAILPSYRRAYESPGSTILVEFTELYKNERAQWQTTSSSTPAPASP